MFDAKQLAGYIMEKYQHDFKEDISSIKLQKSLYFLFAYWGGFVRKGKSTNGDFVEEIIDEDDNLFHDKIEAWVYGPVVPSVFHAYKAGEIKKNYLGQDSLFNDINPIVKSTIDSILDDIFSISDFKLVSISHEDKSWLNHFDEESEYHNEEIPKEEIIQEYAEKSLT